MLQPLNQKRHDSGETYFVYEIPFYEHNEAMMCFIEFHVLWNHVWNSVDIFFRVTNKSIFASLFHSHCIPSHINYYIIVIEGECVPLDSLRNKLNINLTNVLMQEHPLTGTPYYNLSPCRIQEWQPFMFPNIFDVHFALKILNLTLQELNISTRCLPGSSTETGFENRDLASST